MGEERGLTARPSPCYPSGVAHKGLSEPPLPGRDIVVDADRRREREPAAVERLTMAYVQESVRLDEPNTVERIALGRYDCPVGD